MHYTRSHYHQSYTVTMVSILLGSPDAPHDLTLRGNCLNSSANLTWAIDGRPYQALTNFVIQWAVSRATSMWYNVTERAPGSATGHVVRGLNPYSDLVFRVIAVNEYGRSKPSDTTSGQECKTPETSEISSSC